MLEPLEVLGDLGDLGLGPGGGLVKDLLCRLPALGTAASAVIGAGMASAEPAPESGKPKKGG